jgi:SOS-response transcriptional repressor LexA/transcriptional regulator with XRE-family HTH domain
MGLEENLRQLEALRRLLGVAEQGTAFGQEVRLARTNRGMTLEALATATGMAKSYLSQIETGYAPPPRDEKVRKIAEAIGLDGDALIARAHLSQLPDEVKARVGRLSEVFDSTEEMLRALLAARDAAGAPPVPPTSPASTGAPQTQISQAAAPGARDAAPTAGVTAAPSADAPPAASPSDAPPAPAAPEAPVAVDLESLQRSGLLHHLAEWGDQLVSSRRPPLRRIPIINKVSAGYPQDFTDLDYPAGIADDYCEAPPELRDENAFAVRVIGDSMEPKYHEGDVVIVSPAASLTSGADCFVRFAITGRSTDSHATFKRVFHDPGGLVRLQPLNERHPPTIVKPSDIAGIYRAIARYERL